MRNFNVDTSLAIRHLANLNVVQIRSEMYFVIVFLISKHNCFQKYNYPASFIKRNNVGVT